MTVERSSEFTAVEVQLTRAQDLPFHKGDKLMREGIWPVIEDMARRGLETDADELRQRAVLVARHLQNKNLYVVDAASAVHGRE
ncbi:hypothetical protein EBR66_06920 [bacterium]|nr:hypothetical protein [bacterium]